MHIVNSCNVVYLKLFLNKNCLLKFNIYMYRKEKEQFLLRRAFTFTRDKVNYITYFIKDELIEN